MRLWLNISVVLLVFGLSCFQTPVAYASVIKLSDGYPRLSVRVTEPKPGEPTDLREWEIEFNLGSNPTQWDRVLVGQVLSPSALKEPISCAIRDESGQFLPEAANIEMHWLATDTIGWSFLPLDEMSDKDVTITLRVHVFTGTANDVIVGTFINGYSNHTLTHSNRTYSGAASASASSGFDKIELYAPGHEEPDHFIGETLIAPAELNELDFPPIYLEAGSP